MRIFPILAPLAALAGLLAAAPAGAQGFTAVKGPSLLCQGRDLRPEIASQDPALAAEIARQAAAMPFGKGRLFRITRPGVKPSWLFGTVHVSDKRVTVFSPAVQAAMAEARTIALEVAEADQLGEAGVMQAAMASIGTGMLAVPGERAEDVLSKPDFARLEKELQTRKMPAAMANALKPVFLTMVFAEPACVSQSRVGNSFVDLLVARTARAAGKPVVGLETIGEQLSVLASFPGSMQGPYLTASVQLLDRQEDMYETMLRLYVEGEFGWMTAWSRGSRLVPKVDAAMPALFYERLLDMRNATMRDRALPLLAQGGVFIGVGAAHLPGRLGLANLIREAGYTVERVE